jgi:hypothetical protein
LLSNNELLTRDNLSKRRQVDDFTYLFCNEQESIHHLFFDCVVSRFLWESISSCFNKDLGADFESVARWWIREKRNHVLNILSSATMWIIWTIRNEMCFQDVRWHVSNKC